MTDRETNSTIAALVAAMLRADPEGASTLICDTGNTDPTDLAVLVFRLAQLLTKRIREQAAEQGLDDPDELLSIVQQLSLNYATQEGDTP